MPPANASRVALVNRAATLAAAGAIAAAVAYVAWPRGSGADAAHPEIEDFLDRYFLTWSNADMAGYQDCFHPQATISYVRDRGALPMNLKDFIRLQKEGHELAVAPMKEVPLSKAIQADEDVAQAQVRWRLTKADGVTTGTDYFTLVRGPLGWRIISLTYCDDRK